MPFHTLGPYNWELMVRNLLAMLSSRQSSILSGASILMVAVFASKFLGLIRDRLLVHNFSSSQAAVFFAAFSLPDFLFNLLIFGALSVAFIPVFTEHLNKFGEKDAFKFASNILNLSLLLFGVVIIAAGFFIGPINSIAVPGFKGVQKELTDYLTQIILLGQFILVIGAFFVGIAQSYQRFIIPALAPLFYNLGIIIGILLSPYLGIAGPAWGVVLGAAMHVLIQLPLVSRLGFSHKLSFDFMDKGVREVVKLISFRNIGLAVEQLSERVGIALASLIASSGSSITILTFAQHLQTVPIGLFGATIAQAALPVLAKEQAQEDMESFKSTLLTTMHQILFLTLPATAILIVLRIPVVRLVFGASQYTWADTVLTGRTVAFLALGLSAQSVILLFVRGFYALKDTRSPVLISVATVALNIGLSSLFILKLHWQVWSLGLSYAITSITSGLLLLHLLNRKVRGFSPYLLFIPAAKMFLATLILAVALYLPIKALDQVIFDTTRTVNLIILTSIASFFGIGIYLLLVWWLKVRELYTFVNLFKKFTQVRSNLSSQEIIKDAETF